MNDAQQPLNALPQGYRLQEYELVRVLGFGGFGMTYLGFDHNLDKAVAIKEYLPSDIATRTSDNSVAPQASQFRGDFEWGLDRFVDEARALARFDHRHIIKVHRFFEAHGTAYIVMEYAEGETLSAFLERKGTLKESELKSILYPILDGLEVVHRADFLHRDIKPGNIIIRDEDDSPVLLDFGSARQAIGARSRSVTSIITPGYAPIEQYSSRGDQGPWTDIYALGGVCYRALTGEVPYDATDRMRDDPLIPVSERCAGQVSAEFLSAIDWALAVDEGDRPQSITEWRAKLEGTTVTAFPSGDDSSISVAPVEEASTPSAVSQVVASESERQPRVHGKVLWGALGLCLLLVSLGGYLWWENKKSQAKIERYEEKFKEALKDKDFIIAGIYVDSIRVIDSDAPMLSELESRLSSSRQAERWRQEQAEKQRQEQARWVAEQAEKRRQEQAALLEKQRQEQARLVAEQAEKQRQEQAALLEKQRQAFVAKVGRMPQPRGRHKGETDLHITAKLNLPMLTIFLLKSGADINAKDNDGNTPLHWAAYKDASATAEILLKASTNIYAKNNEGRTPLHSAALQDASATAEILLKSGADVHAKDNTGRTPLHWAAQKNAHRMVEVLLKHGADVNAKINGVTPLRLAIGQNAREAAEVLRRYGGREK
ncbi:MAG: protein kinase [Gemmatimonadetes bacterium]|nr:protein kinase [Gemmatimonadota bacterium]MYK54313.1 protein kinase [Gemmatimonadota bacterium]